MLVLNPGKRIKSWDILQHSYFNDIHTIVPPDSYKYFLRSKAKRGRVNIGASIGSSLAGSSIGGGAGNGGISVAGSHKAIHSGNNKS